MKGFKPGDVLKIRKDKENPDEFSVVRIDGKWRKFKRMRDNSFILLWSNRIQKTLIVDARSQKFIEEIKGEMYGIYPIGYNFTLFSPVLGGGFLLNKRTMKVSARFPQDWFVFPQTDSLPFILLINSNMSKKKLFDLKTMSYIEGTYIDIISVMSSESPDPYPYINILVSEPDCASGDGVGYEYAFLHKNGKVEPKHLTFEQMKFISETVGIESWRIERIEGEYKRGNK